MKHLLIVYHSQTGKNQAMAQAVYRGTQNPEIDGVDTKILRAGAAGAENLLWADAVILGTPENFGYMSGAMKDFLDRAYYPCEGKLEATAFALFIGTGNDGTMAALSIRRILNGLAFKEVHEPIIVVGDLSKSHISALEELGATLAAGLEVGIF